MRLRTDGRAFSRAGLAAAWLLVGLAWAAPAPAGEIKSFKFPVPTFDQNGAELDDDLTAADVPHVDNVTVYGYWPKMTMLLIQLRPEDPRSAVYISYSAVVMRDQALWDAKMKEGGALVCAHRLGMTIPTMNPNLITTGSKGFKNPC